MKTILILVATCCMACLANAQQYQYVPLPTDQMQWLFNYSNPNRGSFITGRFLLIQTGEDTVLSGQTYKKIFRREAYGRADYIADIADIFAGGIREDQKKIYAIGDLITMHSYTTPATYPEHLLFDFNLSEGDTLGLNEITKIDTITIGNSQRKRFHWYSTVWAIEGVGVLTGIWSQALCVSDQINMLYSPNNDCAYVFPYGTPTSVDHTTASAKISVYPVPFSNSITIEAPAAVLATIYNIVGTEVLKQPVDNKTELRTDHLSAGTYFLKLSDNTGGTTHAQRLIKE